MKLLILTIVLSISLLSCRKDPPPDNCVDAINEFKTHTTYEGTISFCNAQPPLQSWIPAIATVSFTNSNTFQLQLVADSIGFDTILSYDIQCDIAEEIIPIISFDGQTNNDMGWYSDGIEWITIKFGYPHCLNNTVFEGKSQ